MKRLNLFLSLVLLANLVTAQSPIGMNDVLLVDKIVIDDNENKYLLGGYVGELEIGSTKIQCAEGSCWGGTFIAQIDETNQCKWIYNVFDDVTFATSLDLYVDADQNVYYYNMPQLDEIKNKVSTHPDLLPIPSPPSDDKVETISNYMTVFKNGERIENRKLTEKGSNNLLFETVANRENLLCFGTIWNQDVLGGQTLGATGTITQFLSMLDKNGDLIWVHISDDDSKNYTNVLSNNNFIFALNYTQMKKDPYWMQYNVDKFDYKGNLLSSNALFTHSGDILNIFPTVDLDDSMNIVGLCPGDSEIQFGIEPRITIDTKDNTNKKFIFKVNSNLQMTDLIELNLGATGPSKSIVAKNNKYYLHFVGQTTINEETPWPEIRQGETVLKTDTDGKVEWREENVVQWFTNLIETKNKIYYAGSYSGNFEFGNINMSSEYEEFFLFEIDQQERHKSKLIIRSGLETGITDIFNSSPEEQIMLFPNPANDVIQISVPETVQGSLSINVYNMMGQHVLNQKVFKTSIESETISLQIQHLTKGVYQIRITDENSQVYEKSFVKN